jgi:hypothetical protein
MATSTRANASSAANINPVGPPPAITTEWFVVMRVTVRHDRGLAASPRLWHTLAVERGGSRAAPVAKWLRLAELLAAGDDALRERLALAVTDPALYVQTHARELEERGVTKPIARLPLIALLDGLDAAKRVALLDWKSPAEDVQDELRALRPRVKIDWAWMKGFEEDELDDISTTRLLQAVAAHAPPKIALVNLDTSSDQLAIAFVETSRVRPIITAMKAVGHPAEAIAAKAVAPPKRSTKIPRRGTPLTSWPKCEKDAFGTWRYFMNRKTLRSLYLIKYTTAFDVMLGPSWSTNMKTEKRVSSTAARCTAAYVAFYAQLQRDGWLQLTAEEQAKEVRANAAAKKRGELRKER